MKRTKKQLSSAQILSVIMSIGQVRPPRRPKRRKPRIKPGDTSQYVIAWQSKGSNANGKGDKPMSREDCDRECDKQNELYGKRAFYYPSKIDTGPKRRPMPTIL